MERIENKRKISERGINSPNIPILLTIKEAAKKLNISVWAMRTRIWNGDIPVVTFPGEIKQYLDVRDLEKLVEQNKHICEL